jgi:hypothetical protein
MHSGANYTDAEEANEDTGLWLGYVSVFGAKNTNNSIFAGGNERPTIRLNNKYKYGIEVPEDIMVMIDIVSENATPKDVTVFISYDYVLKSTPGYKTARVHWLSIGEPSPKEGYVFTVHRHFEADRLLIRLFTTVYLKWIRSHGSLHPTPSCSTLQAICWKAAQICVYSCLRIQIFHFAKLSCTTKLFQHTIIPVV